MNSAVKQLPRLPSRAFGLWACLACLLTSLPAFGQLTQTAPSGITFVDATLDPVNSIPSRGSPYGVEIKIGSTMAGKTLRPEHTIQRVGVVLPNLSHSYLADLDVLLTGPNNGKVVLLSDIALNQTVSGVNLTIRTDTGATFPDGLTPPVSSGTYRPKNNNPDAPAADETFPDVAGPYSTDFSAFVGQNPIDKSWKLYTLDDRYRDDGSMGPWQLQLWFDPYVTISNVVAGGALTINMKEDEDYIIPVVIDDPDTAASGITVAVTGISNTGLIPNEKDKSPGWSVSAPTSGTTWNVRLRGAANQHGALTANIEVKDGVGTRNFPISIVIAPVNDTPTITALNGLKPSGGYEGTNILRAVQGQLSGIYELKVDDLDSAADLNALVGSAESDNQDLIQNFDIFFSGTGKDRVFTIAPKGEATGSTPYRLFVTDPAGAKSSARSVTVDVPKATDRTVKANPTPITLADAAGAWSTSEINVSGVSAALQKVSVALATLSHKKPEDITVILRGPNNKNIVLMRAAGGANEVSKGRLLFDDAATSLIPDADAIVTGIAGNAWRPASHSAAALPTGAPTGTYETTLAAAFEGINPNGVWRLYAIDETTGEAGEIRSGFVLNLFTRPAIAGVPSSPLRFNEDASGLPINLTLTDLDGTVNSLTVVEDPGNDIVDITGTGAFTAAGSVSRTITITPKLHAFGTTTVTFAATDNSGYVTSQTITVEITAQNDRPTVTEMAKQVVYLGQVAGPVKFAVGDTETALNALTIEKSSDNTNLLPPENIVIEQDPAFPGDFSRRMITLYPLPSKQGVALVTVTVTDSGQEASLTGTVPGPVATRLSATTVLRLDVLGEPSPIAAVTAPIVINDSGAGGGVAKASPYPSSTAELKNLQTQIASIKVNLFDIEVSRPEDLAVAIVSPNNRGVVLMRDQGGSSAADNINLVFRDDAPAVGPIGGTLVSGQFRAAGGGVGVFPDLAGVSFFGTLGEAFAGQNPNGIWKLYVIDDTGNGKGNDAINGGWQLTVETRPAIAAIPDQETTEEKEVVIQLNLGDNQPGIPFLFEFLPADPTLIKSATVEAGTGSTRRAFITPADNRPATAAQEATDITLRVTDPYGNVTQDTFRFTVKQVNDAPTITGLPERFSVPAGTILSGISFTIGDVETATGDLAVSVTSSNPSLLPNANILTSRAGSTVNLTILPAGSQNVSGVDIVITVTDKGTAATTDGKDALPSTRTVPYSAEGNGFLVFDNKGGRISIPEFQQAPGQPYPVRINVSGVKGVVGNARVTLHGFWHTYPDDVTVVLVDPTGTRKVVLMSNAGGVNPAHSIPQSAPITLEFSSAATMAIPDLPAGSPSADKLISRSYRPGRYAEFVNLPTVGSTDPANMSTDLGTFFGANPNGDWLAYVYDDTYSDGGAIEYGISLALETAPALAQITPPPSTPEDTKATLSLVILDSDSEKQPKDITIVPTTILGADIVPTANLKVVGEGLNRTMEVTPVANKSGDVRFELIMSDGKFTFPVRFGFTVLAVDDPPVLTTPAITVVPARVTVDEDPGAATPITLVITDVDSELSVTDLLVESTVTSVVANQASDISTNGPITVVPGTAGTFTVNVTPRPNGNGTTTLRVSMKDKSTTVTTNILFTVNSVNDLPTFVPSTFAFENFTGAKALTAGESKSVNFVVSDVETAARDLVIELSSSNESVIPTSEMIVAASGENRTLTFRTFGSTSAAGIEIRVTIRDGNNERTSKSFFVDVAAPAPDPSLIFSRTGSIAIPATSITSKTGKASPYGNEAGSAAQLSVSGLKGRIYNLGVILEGFGHEAPDDVDLLLVSPDGTGFVFMSDAGGVVPVNALRLEFNDASSNDLRDDGPLASGAYRPRNFGPLDPDVWPDSGVTPSSATTFAGAFRGKDPNGVWKLYIYDDGADHAGEITTGWSLKITTTPVFLIAGNTAPTSQTLTYSEYPDVLDAAPRTISNITMVDPDAGTERKFLEFRVNSKNTSVIPNANVVLDETLNTLTFQPADHQYYNNTESPLVVEVSVVRTSDNATFTMQIVNRINPLNDDPIISRLVDREIEEGGTLPLRFLITDYDVPLDDIRVTVESLNTSVVRNSDIRFAGTTSNDLNPIPQRELDVIIGHVPGITDTGDKTVTIRVTATDTSKIGAPNGPGQDNRDIKEFVLTIRQKNDPPVIAAIAPAAVEAGETKSVEVTVSDPDNTSGIVVTAKSTNQELIKDAKITVSPATAGPGKRLVTFTPELITPEMSITLPATVDITVTATDPGNKTDVETLKVTITPSRVRRYVGGAITIVDYVTAPGLGNPYPSQITVSDLVGDIAELKVEINGFTHGYPDDVDIILESPTGQKVALMSDCGGSTEVSNLNLLFVDTGTPVPDIGPLTSGTWAPNNPENNDIIPGNIPSGVPFTADLKTMYNRSPKGTWNLYVLDDTRDDNGSISSWALIIKTKPRIEFTGSPDQNLNEDQFFSVPFTIVDESFAVETFTFKFESTAPAVVDPTKLQASQIKDLSYEVFGYPTTNAAGTAKITILATSAPFAQVVSNSFNVTVVAQNDPPFFTQELEGQTIRITAGTVSQQIGFDYGDAETQKKDLSFVKTSSNTDLIPLENIFQEGNSLYIVPVGTGTGTSDITLRVTDPQGLFDEMHFTVDVTRALNSQYANTTSLTIPQQGTATPEYPSTINVEGIKGNITKVTASLSKLTHPYPADLDILLVGPQGDGVILMSDVGGGRGLNNAFFTFDDAALALMPGNPADPVPTGSWKPTNLEAGDSFPTAPAAPTGGYPTTLEAAFKGKNPNGVWRLYVVDDQNPDQGSLAGGWVLNIFTSEPSISDIADVTIAENDSAVVQFRVSDADTALSALQVVPSTDRPSLLSLELGKETGADRSLKITPAPYVNGMATVTIQVSDGTTTTTTSFDVNVSKVNYPPVIAGLTDKETPANRVLSVPFTVTDPDVEDAAAEVGATVVRPEIGTVRIDGTGSSRTLVFAPAGLQGTTEVVVTATDGLATVETTITVSVVSPRSLTISEIPDQVTGENTLKSVDFTVTGSDTGNITVAGSSENTVLVNRVVIERLAVGSYRATVVLNANQVGVAPIMIHAEDDTNAEGSTSFDLTVTSANKPPVFGAIPAQRTPRNVPLQVPLSLSDPDNAVETLLLTWSAASPTLVRNITFGSVGTTLIATVRPQTDAVGTTTVTIFADDGTSKVGQSFSLEVYNEGPQLDPIPNQTTKVNVPVTLTLGVRDVDTPLADLVFTGSSSNPSLVSGVTVSTESGAAVATVSLVENAEGTAVVTIKVSDGTTEASQSFTLTVVDEPPVLGAIADQTTTANKPVVITLDVSDPDTALSALVFTSTTSNTNLVAGVTVDVTTGSAVATVNLVEDATGVGTVTIRVSDGRTQVSQTFALQVVADDTEPELGTPTLSVVDGVLTITLTWEHGGELEYADSAVGPWVRTGNTSGSFSEPATHPSRVYRVVRR